jgi:hypothetical protein
MSVLVTMPVEADTGKVMQFLDSGADRMRGVRDAAQAADCLHHRFGVSDGYVVVADERETSEAFQRFFESDPDLPGMMRDAGAQSQPEMSFSEAVSSPDGALDELRCTGRQTCTSSRVGLLTSTGSSRRRHGVRSASIRASPAHPRLGPRLSGAPRQA